MIRLALIGCGAHAETAHAQPLAYYVTQHPGQVELIATCDTAPERADRFCREYGFARTYVDTTQMLDEVQPDAVVATVPIEETPRIGADLLRRGIPCVLEKPPGRFMDEALALAEVARETGTPHMVSMNRRFSPYLTRAATWATAAAPLRLIHARMTRHARTEPEFLWGTGIHVVDAVCSIGGDIAGYDVVDRGVADGHVWYFITIEFLFGPTAIVELLPTAGAIDETFELASDGFQAFARTMGPQGESACCWKDGKVWLGAATRPDDPLYLRDGSYEETSAFLHGLLTGAPLRPTLHDVLPALRICADPPISHSKELLSGSTQQTL